MTQSKKTFAEIEEAFIRAVFQHENDQRNTETFLFSPQNFMLDREKFYYLYISPVFLVTVLLMLILLYRLLWAKNFWKKYGFMFCYTLADLFMFYFQTISVFILLNTKNNFIEYRYCHLCFISMYCVPVFIRGISTWLKVGHAFQRFIIVHKPTNYKGVYNKVTVSVFTVVTISVCLIQGVMLYLVEDGLVKTYAKDKTTSEPIETCKTTSVFGNMSSSKARLAFYTFYLVASFIAPFICLVSLSIAMIYTLRKQARFRQQFRSMSANVEANIQTSRLFTVIICINLFCAFGALISFVDIIATYIFRGETNIETWEVFALTVTIVETASTPFTVIMFSYLSEPVRKCFYRLFLCRSDRG